MLYLPQQVQLQDILQPWSFELVRAASPEQVLAPDLAVTHIDCLAVNVVPPPSQHGSSDTCAHSSGFRTVVQSALAHAAG